MVTSQPPKPANPAASKTSAAPSPDTLKSISNLASSWGVPVSQVPSQLIALWEHRHSKRYPFFSDPFYGGINLVESEPEFLQDFRDSEDGDQWSELLDMVAWVGTEKYGSAFGYYPKNFENIAESVVISISKDGKLLFSGSDVLDHIANNWQETVPPAQLEAFCTEYKLKVPTRLKNHWRREAMPASIGDIVHPQLMLEEIAQRLAKKSTARARPMGTKPPTRATTKSRK